MHSILLFTLTFGYLAHASLWLASCILLYFAMNGAGIYETVVLVPKWSRQVPETLGLFRGSDAPDLKRFWIGMHSILEVSFILSIVMSWHFEPVRYVLLTLFAIHFATRMWTIVYFARAVMLFYDVANGLTPPSPDLQARADRWRQLNYLRCLIYLAVAAGLVVQYFSLTGTVVE